MDAEIRHRTLQLLGIELRKVPRDGDGDGKYDPNGPKLPPGDVVPVPPKLPKKKPHPHHRTSMDGLEDMAAHVDSGVKARHKFSSGQMADTYLVDHNDGGETVEKNLQDVSNVLGHQAGGPHRQADAEQLASLLGRSIGAPVPKVLRTGDDRVNIEVVYGADWEHVKAAAPDPQVREDELTHGLDGLRLGLFDLLVANWDRTNTSNWIVEDDTDRPVGIDHAGVWSEGDYSSGPDTPPEEWALSPFAAAYVIRSTSWSQPMRWADNPLTPDDIDWLSERLAALEDDFDALGRHDWWQFAMDRLDVLAQHATGDEGVFT